VSDRFAKLVVTACSAAGAFAILVLSYWGAWFAMPGLRFLAYPGIVLGRLRMWMTGSLHPEADLLLFFLGTFLFWFMAFLSVLWWAQVRLSRSPRG
jgi:hypothetical protein